jgi:thermostable 8-oxoguanine DNA glycosylase
MDKLIINKEFIKEWSHRYDNANIGDDETEYNRIAEKVQSEISNSNTISYDTFFDIIEWKSQRAKGKINTDSFDLYQTAIRLVLDIPDALKPGLLVWLDGIEIPVASTILNFMYPDRFPIVDFRVTEVLNDAGLLNSYTISKKTYRIYKSVIEDIVNDTGCDIRTIDRALFAYHKGR